MSFANPAGWWLLALAIPIVLLHILRPRRQAVEVSSTYLWQSVARPVSAASPWQKLRPSWLLFAQLLAVLLLAAAVAKPVRITDAPLAQHTVFIIDASGSMAAKDGSPDRLADAKAKARELRRELPTGGIASIVVAAGDSRVELTSSPDADAFHAALSPITTTAGRANWPDAFQLATSLETAGADIGFLVISDGGMTDTEQKLLPAGSRYIRVGDSSINRAIIGLAIEGRGSGTHARVTVANTGGPAATQTLRLDVDGQTEAATEIALDSGEVEVVEIDLPGGERVEAFLEGDDLLDVDDHAYATAAHRRELRVLLAGPPDPFLEAVLASTEGVTVERRETGDPAPGFDLAIYDQVAVPDDPQAPFFAIAPPGGAPAAGVTVTGTAERPAITLVRSDDPLVSDIDFSAVAIGTSQRIDAPVATTLLGAEAAPLLVRGELGGRPFAYLSFGLGDSNLPIQIAFPLLVDRLLTDLTGAVVPPTGLVVGDLLPIEPGATGTVDAPGGTTSEIVPGSQPPTATRPGYYTLHRDGRPDLTVAVNSDPDESHLAPAPALQTPERTPRPGEQPPRGEVSLLKWVIVPMLALLVGEWLLARRRRGVTRRQWRAAVVLRVAVGVLLLAALADLAVIRPADRVATIFLIDGSDSLGSGGKAAAAAWVRDAINDQPRNSLAGVAVFGGDSRIELTMQPDAQFDQPTVKINTARTNLAGALRQAGAVLPADAKRRVVIVSDGRATDGDAAAEAARLEAAGVQVDYHLVTRLAGPDVAVAALDAPGKVHDGESFTLDATIVATQAGPAQLELVRDGQVVDQRVVDLQAGVNAVSFPQTATGGGLVRYQLRVRSAGDTTPENDVAYAAVEVEGTAAVLILEGADGNGADVAEALRAGGLRVDVVPAASMPALDRLGTYQAAVLVDVDVRLLTADQVSTLGAFTRDLGHGLVTIGGTHSYGVGGYLGSELEELLPVISEITDPQRRQTVAEVLSIDTSGSMGACHCAEGGMQRPTGGVLKTDIAKSAAARAIDALSANDEVGVLVFNTEHEWIIDLQQLPSEEVINEGLGSITPAGGTDLLQSLTLAAEKLRESKAALKHIILFTDGFTAVNSFDALQAEAAALYQNEGITVSVIATGEGAADQLEAIAEAGGGRFYPGRDLQQIPQLMEQEAIIASRDFITEGEFLPEVTSSAQPVRDLTSAPPLLGYVATTAKPQASTLLRIGPDHDPLLASWNVGLGKVTSWTSDASERWAQRWATWSGFVDFWSGVVKDTFAAGSTGGVKARVEDGVLKVTVESEAAFPDGAAATARVTGPDLQSHEVRLERTAATTFSGELAVDEAGTFGVGAAVTGPGGPLVSGSTLASQSYAIEYRPGDPDEAALRQLSDRTHGRGAIEPAQAFDPADLEAGRHRWALAGWLLLAAALLWPVAVALSRLALRGTAVAAVRRQGSSVLWRVKGVVRPSADKEPVVRPARAPAPTAPTAAAPPATIGRLLAKKRETQDQDAD